MIPRIDTFARAFESFIPATHHLYISPFLLLTPTHRSSFPAPFLSVFDMAGFRKTLAHRLWQITRVGSPATSSSASRAGSHLLYSGSRDEHGLLRRFLSSFVQKRPIFHPALPPDRHALPVGDRLLERICGLSPDRIRLDLLLPPSAPIPAAAEQEEEEEEEKRPPVARVDAARARLRATGKSCVSHAEFVRICCEASGGDRGMEVARSLDESGAVVVWGNVVFLRPEEVRFTVSSLCLLDPMLS